MANIGVFGGSFNPIHKGHTAVADAALRRSGLDKILFVVANIQPLKSTHDLAPFDDRIEMVKLAISGRKRFEVSDIEGRRGGVSYTVDTLRELIAAHGEDTKLFLVVGSDSIEDFQKWSKPEDILELAELIVYPRGEFSGEDFFTLVPFVSLERLTDAQKHVLSGEQYPQSSTEIRERLAEGKPVDDMIDPAVLEYIKKHNLYTK